MTNILVPGCGQSPMEDTTEIHYINIDMMPANDKVVQHDLTYTPYPLPDEGIDTILFFHTIEHIPAPHHIRILKEFHRLLKPGGVLCISYPEFNRCAANYAANHLGDRDFWAATIYGRQTSEWDCHKALMDTTFFVGVLKECGFTVLNKAPEPSQPHNTVVIALKAVMPPTYAEMMERSYAPKDEAVGVPV